MVSGSAGDFVFHEGDTSLECFVIRDGRVEILKTHHGQPRRLTLLGMGDLFGEGALFDEQSRDVSARAVTEFQLLRIDRATFQRIVQEDPSIAVSMARRLSRYLRVQRTSETPAGPPKLAVLIVPGTEQAFVLADREQWSVGRVGRSAAHKPDIDLSRLLDTEQIGQPETRHHRAEVRRGTTCAKNAPPTAPLSTASGLSRAARWNWQTALTCHSAWWRWCSGIAMDERTSRVNKSEPCL